MNWYQFYTCKRNWYQFFTHVRVIGTNSSHPQKTQVTGVTNTYQFFTHQKLSSEMFTCVRNWYQFFTCEELVPILHTREKVAPVLHRCDEYLPILHTSEIINMRNLNTNFGPQNLSKLTIRIQSTLVISNSKGLYETLRDIRTSTYQICGTEENNKLNSHF